MSHFSVSKVKISNPETNLLRQVVEQMVREMDGKLVMQLRSMEGEVRSDFLVGFTATTMPYGVGVKVVNGQVELVGDFWGREQEKEALQKELTKNYTAAAIATTMRKMGYRVQAQKTPRTVVLIAEN